MHNNMPTMKRNLAKLNRIDDTHHISGEICINDTGGGPIANSVSTLVQPFSFLFFRKRDMFISVKICAMNNLCKIYTWLVSLVCLKSQISNISDF
jgi:hypothetical protein